MIVILCEKREQASKVSAGLGFQLNQGAYSGAIGNQQAIVTWAAGHLLGLEEPQEAKKDASWEDPKSLLPIPTSPKLTVLPDRNKGPSPRDYIKKVRSVLSDATEVWLATDPDREGEAIGWNILEHLRYSGPVKRIWLAGSMEKGGVQKAFANPLSAEKTKTWWRAQQARNSSDWAWQFLVRAYTFYARHGAMGAHLGKGKGPRGVASVGRVQTATLRLIVERDRHITSFKPQDHFTVSGTFGGVIRLPYKPVFTPATQDIRLEGVAWFDNKPLFTSKSIVEDFCARLRNIESGIVETCETKQTLKNPPTPFSLTQLQRHMGKHFKLTASKTQKLAESLRLAGYLTYPRTEHGDLPSELYEPENRNPVLEMLASLQELGSQASKVLDLHNSDLAFKPSCFSDKPMEHHGIIPTNKKPKIGDLEQIGTDAGKVYFAVARQYVQAFYPPAKQTEMVVKIRINTTDLLNNPTTLFAAKIVHIKDQGWIAAFEATKASAPLPTLKKGQSVEISSIETKATRTHPPDHFNDETLLSAMLNAGRQVDDKELAKVLRDCKGIGTPATRSSIIETLLKREYVRRLNNKLVAEPKGFDLIDHTPSDLSQIVTTAVWETELNEVQNSRDDAEATERRDLFIANQIAFIEGHISSATTTMTPTGNPSLQGGPTAKMLAAVQRIAEAKDVACPVDYEHSYSACKVFLDEHLGPVKQTNRPRNSSNRPTAKMVAYAEKLIKSTGAKAPKGFKTDFVICRTFIDKHAATGARGNSKPTPRMVQAVNNIASNKGIKKPKGIETSFDICREFLNEHIGRANE